MKSSALSAMAPMSPFHAGPQGGAGDARAAPLAEDSAEAARRFRAGVEAPSDSPAPPHEECPPHEERPPHVARPAAEPMVGPELSARRGPEDEVQFLKAALADSEQCNRQLVETAQEGICMLDARLRATFVSRKTCQLLGYPASQIEGAFFLQFLHPAERARVGARLRSALRRKQRHNLRFRRADGTELWTAAVSSPVFSREDQRTAVLVMMTDITERITERQQARDALHEQAKHCQELGRRAGRMQTELRSLSKKMVDLQEEERARMSRELHDEVGQLLTAINVNLTMLKREAFATDSLVVEKRISDAQELLLETMKSVHDFALQLRPAMLDDLGLLPALRSCAKSFGERTSIQVQFHAPRNAGRLDRESKTVIYRVVQESLNNVAKHAAATRVEISLSRHRNRLRLRVNDNGKCFCVADKLSLKAPRHLGLIGMRERVRLINGEFSIESKPGEGTTIAVEIPLPANGISAKT